MPSDQLEKPGPGKKNNTLLIRGLTLVIIILVLVLAYFFAFREKEDEAVNANNSSQDNTNTERVEFKAPADEDGNVNAGEEGGAAEEAEKTPEAIARDETRISHIKQIQEALEKFKTDKGNYPEKMDELVPDYLSEIPINPQPGGIDYVYTPIGKLPALYYDLAYELEAGTSEVEDAGTHIANPDGIAYP